MNMIMHESRVERHVGQGIQSRRDHKDVGGIHQHIVKRTWRNEVDGLLAGRITATIDLDMEPDPERAVMLMDVLADPHAGVTPPLAPKVGGKLNEKVGTLANLNQSRGQNKGRAAKVQASCPFDLCLCIGLAQLSRRIAGRGLRQNHGPWRRSAGLEDKTGPRGLQPAGRENEEVTESNDASLKEVIFFAKFVNEADNLCVGLRDAAHERLAYNAGKNGTIKRTQIL
jgi:hypothetical protein